jgi:hypothetical protein
LEVELLTELIVGLFEFIWLFLVAIFNLIKSLILFPIYQPAEAFSLLVLIVAFFVGFLLPFKFMPIDRIFGKGGVDGLDDGFLINLGRYIFALVVCSVAGLCGVGLVFVAGNLLEFVGL